MVIKVMDPRLRAIVPPPKADGHRASRHEKLVDLCGADTRRLNSRATHLTQLFDKTHRLPFDQLGGSMEVWRGINRLDKVGDVVDGNACLYDEDRRASTSKGFAASRRRKKAMAMGYAERPTCERSAA